MSVGDYTYYEEGDPAINAAKEQVKAEALDMVRKAHSVFLVVLTEEDGDLVADSLAYGSQSALPQAVAVRAGEYLTFMSALEGDE